MREEHDVMDWKKLNWYKIGLILCLMLALVAAPAMAASGTFDSTTGSFWQTTYGVSHGGAAGYNITGIKIEDTQNWTGFYSLYADISGSDTAPSHSGSTAVSIYSGNTIVGTGIFGYSYDAITAKYGVYLHISSWNTGTMTGEQLFNFTTPALAPVWSLNQLKGSGPSVAVLGVNEGNFAEAGALYTPTATVIRVVTTEFHNTYATSYTPPISDITVTKLVNTVLYPSKVYVMSGTTVKASNTTLTGDTFTASIVNTPFFTINVTDLYGNWYVTPIIYGSGSAPTYTISVLPTNITTTTSASGGLASTTDTTLAGLTDIAWKWSDDTGTYNFNEGGNVSRPLDYTNKGGTWYGYEVGAGGLGGSYILNKGTNVPNPVTLSNIPTTGNKTIICFIGVSDGNWYELTTPITVGGAGTEAYTTTRAVMIDWASGSHLNYGTISFRNLATGVWTNLSTNTGDGIVSISSSPVAKWDIYGNAAGYMQSVKFGMSASQSPASINLYSLPMYPTSYDLTAHGGKTTLYTTVTELCQQQYQSSCSNLPLSGVTVTIRDITNGSIFSSAGTTGSGSSGTVTMYIPNNTAYFWSASGKPGYQSVSGYFAVVAEPVYTLSIQMPQIFITPTPSLAPGATPLPTGVTPTVTATKKVGQSEEEYQVDLGVGILAKYIVPWINLGASVITIWLLWILVYEITGGKVLDKLMRRGRK